MSFIPYISLTVKCPCCEEGIEVDFRLGEPGTEEPHDLDLSHECADYIEGLYRRRPYGGQGAFEYEHAITEYREQLTQRCLEEYEHQGELQDERRYSP